MFFHLLMGKAQVVVCVNKTLIQTLVILLWMKPKIKNCFLYFFEKRDCTSDGGGESESEGAGIGGGGGFLDFFSG